MKTAWCVAALERLVGKQALELEFLKGAQRPGTGVARLVATVVAEPERRHAGTRLVGLAAVQLLDLRLPQGA